MIWKILWCVFCVVLGAKCEKEAVLMTEVFEIQVYPQLFNWSFEGINEQFLYQPSLMNAPDLPSWINYVYSDRHHAGILYGVPPNIPNKEVYIEIIALNRRDYSTRSYLKIIQVTEKLNPAKHEVQLKIDNLNVQDMFDVERMERLKDIFRKRLWRDSQNDLYVTFMASAVKLGARLPLNPKEGEGVVLRLGSIAPLSNELIELQEEVKPLWKVPSCPRDFKRTTVERLFRENGFAMDWCTFRLLEDKSDNEELVNNISKEIKDDKDRWESISRNQLPNRSYAYELAFSVILPMFILFCLVSLLTLILCLDYDEYITDRQSEEFFESLFHICIDHFSEPEPEMIVDEEPQLFAPRPTHTLRSVNNPPDMTCLSPESVLISRSLTNSPNSTMSRGLHCRPSPPPYVRPKNKPSF